MIEVGRGERRRLPGVGRGIDEDAVARGVVERAGARVGALRQLSALGDEVAVVLAGDRAVDVAAPDVARVSTSAKSATPSSTGTLKALVMGTSTSPPAPS